MKAFLGGPAPQTPRWGTERLPHAPYATLRLGLSNLVRPVVSIRVSIRPHFVGCQCGSKVYLELAAQVFKLYQTMLSSIFCLASLQGFCIFWLNFHDTASRKSLTPTTSNLTYHLTPMATRKLRLIQQTHHRLWGFLGIAIASVYLTWILGVNTTTIAIANTPSPSLPNHLTEQTGLISTTAEMPESRELANTPIVFPSSAEIDAKTRVLFERLFEGFGTFNILIIFLLTLGPLKLIGSFAKLTMNAEPTLRRQLALRSFGISTLVIFGVAILCQNVLKAWRIEVSAMLITTGIILFSVALRTVLAQYNPPTNNNAPPVNPSLELTLNPLVFPYILTPYGIGIVVTLSAIFGHLAIASNTLFLLLLLVMVLNLGAMLAARPLLSIIKPVTLKVLGFVFGVMQVALGLDMILTGLKIEAIALKFLVG